MNYARIKRSKLSGNCKKYNFNNRYNSENLSSSIISTFNFSHKARSPEDQDYRGVEDFYMIDWKNEWLSGI